MKNLKKEFKDLVSKMDSLSEMEEGKLKGGFSSLKKSVVTFDDNDALNIGYCRDIGDDDTNIGYCRRPK